MSFFLLLLFFDEPGQLDAKDKMSRNGQFDPGGRDYQNGAPIDPPTYIFNLYDPNREYRQDGMAETSAVLEGLTVLGQARRTPNNARLVAETDVDHDGSQSMAYASNLAIQSEQVANHRPLSYPVQATPSDDSSDSSDETAGNLEPLALRVDNQPLVTPRTEAMSRRHDVRAETNQLLSTAYDSSIASESNGNDRQMHSGYIPRANQLATSNQVHNRAAASLGTDNRVPDPAILHASLSDYLGQEVFSNKWWKCLKSFQNKTNVDARAFADQLICFTNIANQIKCLECNNSCDINVKFDHKPLCPVKNACTQITLSRSAQVADISGTQGASGFTPTFVPPSAERLEISRGNREMRPANQRIVRHSEQHGPQHSAVTQLHSEGHATSLKTRMPAASQGATGYTPLAFETRRNTENRKSHSGFERRDIAQPPEVQQLEATLSRRSQENCHTSSTRTSTSSGETSAEAFLIEAGYDPRAIQEFKKSYGLQSMDSIAVCVFLKCNSKDSM